MCPLKEYELLNKIGYGTYATVHRARFKGSEDVAIKIVEKAKLSSTGRDNIVTEIRVLKMLKHKHIVEMKDFKWDDRYIYIVMEYCDGGDLSTLIKTKYQLSERICQRFLQQLALAVQFLRSHNISHLDLKPQNLLLSTAPRLTLKIGDFGFAKFLSGTTQEHSIRGSPLYMAPEMLLGDSYDARADLWSIGIITYECLFGRAPYSSQSYNSLCAKIRSQAPITIPERSNISDNCRDFLTSLLKSNPEERLSYDGFFSHPFIDLEHTPSTESYEKAVAIVNDAIKLDQQKKPAEAFNKYCEALLYFIPILDDEVDENKKVALRRKITDYTTRAEQLKNSISLSTVVIPKKLESLDKYKNTKDLFALCSNTPKLASALEIGVMAQMYLADGLYKLALEKFESSLGVLVTSIMQEPLGPRRDLLHQKIQEWMALAESTKALLSSKQNENTPQVSGLPVKGKRKLWKKLLCFRNHK